MDNQKQKEEILKYLQTSYTGAKMMRDEEVMLRTSRAIAAFKADIHEDIFITENIFRMTD